MIPTIKSEQFVLRPFRKGDERSLRENINNKEIVRHTAAIPHPYTRMRAERWIKHCLSTYRRGNKSVLSFSGSERKKSELHFAIDIGGEVAGGISLFVEDHKAEFGYWLARKYWGKGIMTTVVRLLCRFAFTKLKLRRLYATASVKNRASARVLEKNGFKLEGIMRRNYIKNGRFLDSLLYAKVR